MHLVALVSAPDHVCCRYRIQAFRPWFEDHGHSLTICPLPRHAFARWRLFRQLRGATVLLQRHLLPGWQLRHLRSMARYLLFDFDDAIFLRDSYAPRGLHHPRRLRRFASTMQLCDLIVAGNGFLADHAAVWAGRERVHLIPTCVDLRRYPRKLSPLPRRRLVLAASSAYGPSLYSPEQVNSEPVSAASLPEIEEVTQDLELVWIGSSSTLQGLERIAPMLDELARRIPGLRLKVICDRFPRFRALPVIPCRWSEATEARELASSHIGISWVPDDLWSQGKCGLKVLQYQAAGLPVIANPVGVHRDLIRHGENGFLASSLDEWYEAIQRLRVEAAAFRLGHAGRRGVEERFTVAHGAQLWLQALQQLHSSSARAG